MKKPIYRHNGMIFIILCLSIYRAIGTEPSPNAYSVINPATHKVQSGVLMKKSPTNEFCLKACLEETSIKCQFFEFISSTKSCYLSETDSQEIRNLVQLDTKRLMPGKNNTSVAYININSNRTHPITKTGGPTTVKSVDPMKELRTKYKHKEPKTKDKHKEPRTRQKHVDPIEELSTRYKDKELRTKDKHKDPGTRHKHKDLLTRYKDEDLLTRHKYRKLRNRHRYKKLRNRHRYRKLRNRHKHKPHKIIKNMHHLVTKIGKHVESQQEIKKRILYLYSGMREIKTILELLIGKLMGDHKSVSTLRKYLKKGFSKIAQDELSIDKSNRTQINLIKAVLGMHNAYDKLDNFAKYSNFTRKELISELKKLKAFEGNLKHAVVHMMLHSHRMDAKMKQIKSAIEEKADNSSIDSLKYNQIMVIKALMEIQKHGSGFLHHMDKFEARMRQIWSALRFGHKRRTFFQRKLETIENIVRNIKSPNITITGSDQISREINHKYKALRKIHSAAMTKLKDMESRLNDKWHHYDPTSLKKKQLLIFKLLKSKMEYDRHEIEKKKTIDAHMRKLSKANKIIDSKISKLSDAMKKNLVSKKTQKTRLKALGVLHNEYKMIRENVEKLLIYMESIKKQQIKNSMVRNKYNKLVKDVVGIQKKMKEEKKVAMKTTVAKEKIVEKPVEEKKTVEKPVEIVEKKTVMKPLAEKKTIKKPVKIGKITMKKPVAECTKKNEKLTNVALKKKTFQTSTYGGRRRKYYSSAQAVDGLSNTFSMTNKVRRVNPGWYVDLGGIYTIRHIVIFNRRKTSGNRLHNVVIGVGTNFNKMKTFATFKGPGKNGAHYEFKCKEVTTGRYVMVIIKGEEYLTLAEVQVYSPEKITIKKPGKTEKITIKKPVAGKITIKKPVTGKITTKKPMGVKIAIKKPVAECTKKNEKLTNVALKKKTFQSSTYGGRRKKYYSSAQAVDGLSKTFSITNKVRSVNPYWYVDLGGIYMIRHIDIFNRRRTSGNRLHNVVISVGSNLSKMNTFATFEGPGKSGAHYVFKCKEVTTGRYVKVMIKGEEYLTLAEVQVFSPAKIKIKKPVGGRSFLWQTM